MGLVASLSRDLLPWLRLRLSGMARTVVSDTSASTLGGLSLLAALDGAY